MQYYVYSLYTLTNVLIGKLSATSEVTFSLDRLSLQERRIPGSFTSLVSRKASLSTTRIRGLISRKLSSLQTTARANMHVARTIYRSENYPILMIFLG